MCSKERLRGDNFQRLFLVKCHPADQIVGLWFEAADAVMVSEL